MKVSLASEYFFGWKRTARANMCYVMRLFIKMFCCIPHRFLPFLFFFLFHTFSRIEAIKLIKTSRNFRVFDRRRSYVVGFSRKTIMADCCNVLTLAQVNIESYADIRIIAVA